MGVGLQGDSSQLQFQLSYTFWFQRQQLGGGAGHPHPVTVTRELGYSQFCQHIGSTRTEGSVPHQLGRDLAYAEAGDTVRERLPMSCPSAGAPSHHHVTSRTGSSRAFPYLFFFSFPYFFIFPVCQLNLKPQNSQELSPLIEDGKHFLIPPPRHIPSVQLPPKYISISCRQFCPCISPIAPRHTDQPCKQLSLI